ncbi:17399_t:CDS:2 [Funneliformis caledonium]|uniref:17399_t:CDS:1 n=1 Tax=Funneliformis caledonium TaxID=1117310 RepID=A0A9N9EV79_9GLOM|nr:17399_t:CDS:2 [Funneliformis caledonium]
MVDSHSSRKVCINVSKDMLKDYVSRNVDVLVEETPASYNATYIFESQFALNSHVRNTHTIITPFLQL